MWELTEFPYDPQSVDVVGFSLQSQARSLDRTSGQFRYGTWRFCWNWQNFYMTLKVLMLWVFLCNLKLDLWTELRDSLDMEHSGFDGADRISIWPSKCWCCGFFFAISYIYIPGVTHCTLHSQQMENRKGEEPFLFSLWMKWFQVVDCSQRHNLTTKLFHDI